TDDEFEDAEFERFPENKNVQNEGPQVAQDNSQSSRTAFRFPLIDDEAIVATEQPKQPNYEQTQYEQQKYVHQNNNYKNTDNEEFKLPQYLQKPTSNTVYDVEVSGIRDLLERRRKGRGHSNVIRSQDSTEPRAQVTRAEREILTTNPKREERKINKEFVNPLANRKRFVPTDVPSPVHGFQKLTPIETLMERQQPAQSDRLHNESPSAVTEKVESKVAPLPANEEIFVHSENTKAQKIVPVPVEQQVLDEVAITTVEPVIEKEPIPLEVEITDVSKEVLNNTVFSESHRAPSIQAEEVEEESINEVQVKHVTIENSTIHIGQLNVEQVPQTEEVQVTDENRQVAQQLRESTGSRVPFNVVMLKSDKQKLMARQLLEQQIYQAQTTQSAEIQEFSYEKNIEDELIKEDAHLNVVDEEISEPIIEQLVPPVEICAESLQEIVEHEQLQMDSELLEQKTESIDKLVQIEVESIEELSKFIPEQIEQAMTGEIVDEKIEELSEVVVEESKSESIEEPIDLSSQKGEVVLDSFEPIQQVVEVKKIPYVKPPLDFLVPPEEMLEDREWMDEQGERLVEALS
ncbi:MAG: hypothetical protein RR603_04240, partial [Kurthia sp.]